MKKSILLFGVLFLLTNTIFAQQKKILELRTNLKISKGKLESTAKEIKENWDESCEGYRTAKAVYNRTVSSINAKIEHIQTQIRFCKKINKTQARELSSELNRVSAKFSQHFKRYDSDCSFVGGNNFMAAGLIDLFSSVAKLIFECDNERQEMLASMLDECMLSSWDELF